MHHPDFAKDIDQKPFCPNSNGLYINIKVVTEKVTYSELVMSIKSIKKYRNFSKN